MKTDFFRSENCAVLTGHRGEAEIAAGELLPRRHCSIYAFSVNPCSSSVPRFVRRFVRHSSTHALIFKVSPALAGGRGAEPGFGWDSAEPGLVAVPDLSGGGGLAVRDERLLVYSIGPDCSLARAPILATVFKRFILSQSGRHRNRHADQSTAHNHYQVFGSDRLHKEQTQARLEFLGPLQIILQAAGEFHRTALFRHCRKHVHFTAQLLSAGASGLLRSPSHCLGQYCGWQKRQLI
jgi:hypothetical protein